MPHVDLTPESGAGMTAESSPGTDGDRLGIEDSLFALSSRASLCAGGFGGAAGTAWPDAGAACAGDAAGAAAIVAGALAAAVWPGCAGCPCADAMTAPARP